MSRLEELKREFGNAIKEGNGVRLGNVASKLRNGYMFTHNKLIQLAMQSGLDAADYDELVRVWDDSDNDGIGTIKEY